MIPAPVFPLPPFSPRTIPVLTPRRCLSPLSAFRPAPLASRICAPVPVRALGLLMPDAIAIAVLATVVAFAR